MSKRLFWAVEALAVCIGFLLAWGYLTSRAGYPVSWDEILYMHTALNTDQQAWILNRYFHVYLQKLFMGFVSGDPFRAAQIYWSFMIAGTGALTYIATRLLVPARFQVAGCTVGLIAVLFYSIQPLILSLPGVIYADYSVMLMIALAVVVFAVHIRIKRASGFTSENPLQFSRLQTVTLIILGLIFFLGMKSKETSIVIGVLTFGFGFAKRNAEDAERFYVARWLKALLIFALGAIAGLLLFMLLDYILLGDALFGLRPENWRALFDFNLGQSYVRGDVNYLEPIGGTVLLPVAVFAVLAYRRGQVAYEAGVQLLWVLPLAIIAFLTLSMIRGAWGVHARYLVVTAPVLATLAALYFAPLSGIPGDDAAGKPANRLPLAFIIALTTVLILTQAVIFPLFAQRYGWLDPHFHNAILIPLTLCLVFLIAVGLPSQMSEKFYVNLAILGCAIIIALPIVVQVIEDMEGRAFVAQNSAYRWMPYDAFAPLIQASDTSDFFITGRVYREHKMLGDSPLRDRWMFNLYFHTFLRTDQFHKGGIGEVIAESEGISTDYVILAAKEWFGLSSEQKADIFASGRAYADADQRVYLIKNNGEDGGGQPESPVVQDGRFLPIAPGYQDCLIVYENAEPGIVQIGCFLPATETYSTLGWAYQQDENAPIGASVADEAEAQIVVDQLVQMAISKQVFRKP